MTTESASKSPRRLLDVSRDDGVNLKRKGRLENPQARRSLCVDSSYSFAEGGQLGDAGRFEAPVPDEVPKIEMRKVGDARVSPLHYGDDAAEGV